MRAARIGVCMAVLLLLVGGCKAKIPATTATTPLPVVAGSYMATLVQLANENGIALSSEESAAIAADAAADAVLLIAAGEPEQGLVEELSEEYTRDLLEKKVCDKLFQDITATEKEAQAWYDTRIAAMRDAFAKDPGVFKSQQEAYEAYGGVRPLVVPEGYIRVRHILVADVGTAEAVLIRLKKGEDFFAVAEELSSDAAALQEPYRTHGYLISPYESTRDYVQAIKTAALALHEVGAYSEAVPSQQGYHIVQLIEKMQAGELPFEEVRAEIFALLTAARQQEALRALVQERMGA